MAKYGKENPNYRHGKHCEPNICECGRDKDYRSNKCAVCSKRGFCKASVEDDKQERILALISSCENISEVARLADASREFVRKTIRIHQVDISHFRGGKDRDASFESVFCISNKKRYQTIKRYILKWNLLPYVCAINGCLPIWFDKPLVLEIDHINGNPFDNTLENLRFVCPNCHTQTDTNKGKRSRGIPKERSIPK